MPPEDEPQDPMTLLGQSAAATAEMYMEHVKAGMPPLMVAIMLGVMHGYMATFHSGDAEE